MNTTTFLRALEQALEIDSGAIAGTESLADTAWWDSMAALTFMAVADQECHVTLTGAQIAQCKTVPDLLALIGHTLET